MARTTVQRADVWMLVREHPTVPVGSTLRLAEALAEAHGSRFALWRTDELVLGVRGGRLELYTLGGERVPAPTVVCVRQVPGSMRDEREVTLLRHLRRMGAVLLNPVDAHLACRNKFQQLQELALAGLPVPDTLSYTNAPLEGVLHSPRFRAPCVVKAVRGSKGGQVFLAPDTRMLHDVRGSLALHVPLLFQEYVAGSHGRDLRVVVVDGEPVGAETRTARDGALTSNLATGGRATLCAGEYPEAEELAVRAARALGLAIAGVDLLFGPDDTFVVCEVNAVPGWRPGMTGVTSAVLALVDRSLAAAEAPVTEH
ncbi:RimK family alpha-L-glutamate ligase [Streptomyces sp. NPDC057116]|uniref:ATP-grasp domain-containing protein n=1 Tax=Streptomyces sp. NPDC057116 TaxID=3346023 RepID=UPI00362ABB79